MTESQAAKASKEFEQEGRFHRREWAVQRAGWIAMALLVIAASLGLLGGAGPYARVEAGGDAPSLKIAYDRFARYAATSEVQVSIDAAGSRSFALEINDAYLQEFDIQSITPEPQAMDAAAGRVVMTFEATSTPATIIFRLKPETIGSHIGVFRASSGHEVVIKQFVYP